MKKFLNNTILCTSFDYKEDQLRKVLAQKFELQYEQSYIDIINKCIKEIVQSNKNPKHLQDPEPRKI